MKTKKINELLREEACPLGSRPDPSQIGLYSYSLGSIGIVGILATFMNNHFYIRLSALTDHAELSRYKTNL